MLKNLLSDVIRESKNAFTVQRYEKIYEKSNYPHDYSTPYTKSRSEFIKIY